MELNVEQLGLTLGIVPLSTIRVKLHDMHENLM